MKKVTINGISYIGDLKEEDGKVTLVDAMKAEDASQANLAEYLKLKNLEELETIEFGGQGVSFSVSEFSDDENMNMELCNIAMKMAQSKALKSLENSSFDQYLGK